MGLSRVYTLLHLMTHGFTNSMGTVKAQLLRHHDDLQRVLETRCFTIRLSQYEDLYIRSLLLSILMTQQSISSSFSNSFLPSSFLPFFQLNDFLSVCPIKLIHYICIYKFLRSIFYQCHYQFSEYFHSRKCPFFETQI